VSRPLESPVDRLAVVVQRYGLEINGGAEYHARLIAEKLSAHFQVEVFSSTALDYLTWAPHYPVGRQTVNGVRVNRFDVDRQRDPERFGRLQEKVFNQEHSVAEELLWLEENGPFLPGLVTELQARQDEFRRIIFFSYRYYHSWAGIRAMPHKALLVPTAEHDQVIQARSKRSRFITFQAADKSPAVENRSRTSPCILAGVDFRRGPGARSSSRRSGRRGCRSI
jgi:hypothetical protein